MRFYNLFPRPLSIYAWPWQGPRRLLDERELEGRLHVETLGVNGQRNRTLGRPWGRVKVPLRVDSYGISQPTLDSLCGLGSRLG